MYCLRVNVYCHRVTTQLQLINISLSISAESCEPVCHGARLKITTFLVMTPCSLLDLSEAAKFVPHAGTYVPNYRASYAIIFTLKSMEHTVRHYLLGTDVSVTCHWEMSQGLRRYLLCCRLIPRNKAPEVLYGFTR